MCIRDRYYTTNSVLLRFDLVKFRGQCVSFKYKEHGIVLCHLSWHVVTFKFFSIPWFITWRLLCTAMSSLHSELVSSSPVMIHWFTAQLKSLQLWIVRENHVCSLCSYSFRWNMEYEEKKQWHFQKPWLVEKEKERQIVWKEMRCNSSEDFKCYLEVNSENFHEL